MIPTDHILHIDLPKALCETVTHMSLFFPVECKTVLTNPVPDACLTWEGLPCQCGRVRFHSRDTMWPYAEMFCGERIRWDTQRDDDG